MDFNEFAEKFKAKNPAYADRDNKALAEALIKKHPVYKDKVEFNYVQPGDTEVDLMNGRNGASRQARIDTFINDPIKNAAKNVIGSMPFIGNQEKAFEPITADPNASPLQQVGQSMLDLAQNPTRLSPTIAQPGQLAGEQVEEAIGPEHPTLGKTAGFVTSAALDPTSYAGAAVGSKVGKAVKPVAEFAGEQAAKLAEGLSNVPLKNIKALFRNPFDILKAPSSKEAGKSLEIAKKLAGITEDEEFLIAKAADRSMGGARSVGEALRNQFKTDPTSLTTGELMALNRAAGKLSSAPGSEGALWSAVKKQVSERLKERSSQISDALDQYAKSKTKESFMNLFPRSKSGKVDYFKAVGTGLTKGLTSPLAVGLGTLGAKVATEIAKPLAKPVGALTGFSMGQILQEKHKRDIQSLNDRLKK